MLWPFVWQAIVPAGGLSGRRPTDHHAVRNLFLRLHVSRHQTTKPEKFVAYRAGGLKGRLQSRLPAARMAKAEQAAFQAAFATHDELLGLRRSMPYETKPKKYPHKGRAARLDKLKHVPHSDTRVSAPRQREAFNYTHQ